MMESLKERYACSGFPFFSFFREKTRSKKYGALLSIAEYVLGCFCDKSSPCAETAIFCTKMMILARQHVDSSSSEIKMKKNSDAKSNQASHQFKID
jgi:hypothetical protein